MDKADDYESDGGSSCHEIRMKAANDEVVYDSDEESNEDDGA